MSQPTVIVSGNFDRLDYTGQYWPSHIEPCPHLDVLRWLERSLFILQFPRRTEGFRVLEHTKITEVGARRLSEAASKCWDGILDCDLQRFGEHMHASHDAQLRMFPNMMTPAPPSRVEHR